MSIIGTTSTAGLTNDQRVQREETLSAISTAIYGANKRRNIVDAASALARAIDREPSSLAIYRFSPDIHASIDPLADQAQSVPLESYATASGAGLTPFLPGLNLILGTAGSGKSTLLTLVHKDCLDLCRDVQIPVYRQFIGEPGSNYPAIRSIEEWAASQALLVYGPDRPGSMLFVDSLSSMLTASELASASAIAGGESSALTSYLIDLNNMFVGLKTACVAVLNLHNFTRLPDFPGSVASSWLAAPDQSGKPGLTCLHWRAPASTLPESSVDFRYVDRDLYNQFALTLRGSVESSGDRTERPAIADALASLNLT